MRWVATICLLWCSHALAQAPSVADLDWLTGSWAGPVGDQVLEEVWNDPAGGTIAALVRMGSEKATTMLEMIVINEEDDTLMLRIQQFSRRYEPRFPTPQTMRLSELGANTATFTATGTGGLKGIVYVREDDQLTITVTLPDDNLFIAPLSAR